MFTSYAQNFEDVLLWRALKHVDRGFYVDVGAQDPIIDSVSMGFYEQGWRGVHVEPVTAYAEKLRKQRTDELVIDAALGEREQRLAFFEVAGTGLSTADRRIAERHREAGFAVRQVEVPCLTLSKVLCRRHGADVHWLKIDVEGYEREVLAGWTSDVRPWIVLIESTLPLTESASHQAWEHLVLAKGYDFAYFDGVNRFYVSSAHPELAEALRHGPSFFDDFFLSETVPYCAKLNARIQDLERREAEANGRAAAANQRAATAERRTLDAERHIAAMTRTISWRITAPLRKFKQRLRRISQGSSMRSAWNPTLHGTLAFAKRSGLYARLAPWLRERYPGVWARAKRILLDRRPAVHLTGHFAGGEPDRAPVRNYVPHDSGDATLDDIATRGSVSLQELESMLEIEARRRRNG